MWWLLLVCLSYQDRNVVKGKFLSDAYEGFATINSTICAGVSVVGINYLHRVSDGLEEVRSVVSPAGKLLACSVVVDPVRVESFMHVCRLGLKGHDTQRYEGTGSAHLDQAKAACAGFTGRPELRERPAEQPTEHLSERPAEQTAEQTAERQAEKTAENTADQPSEQTAEENAQRVSEQPSDQPPEQLSEQLEGVDHSSEILKRSKRGFTYPGTLWCGAGNMAEHYDQLGEFADTDSCCRVHDHCPHVIHALSSKYGYMNLKWHSICHCECDNALKQCLRKVNDTASRVVGQAFFNVMEVPCFEFDYEDQCVERHWYGLCRKYEKLPVAALKQSIPYDFGGIDVIDVLTIAPSQNQEGPGGREEQEGGPTPPIAPGPPSAGPGEPSLKSVVTAAEDFIKVLATVSTSQSSAADSAKGETPATEKKKKKKKNSGKETKRKKQKTTNKRKRKGKGGNRKPKVDADVGGERGAAGNKAEIVMEESNFINQAEMGEALGRNTNRFIDGKFDSGNEETSNEVMKDQPVMEEIGPVTSHTTAAQKDPGATAAAASRSTTTMTAVPPERQTPRTTKGARKRKMTKIKSTSSPEDIVINITPTEESVWSATNHLSIFSAPTIVTLSPTGQKLERSERGSFLGAAGTPIVTPRAQRSRSKERSAGEGRKKRRKTATAAPIMAANPENSTADVLRGISGGGGASIAARTPTTEPAEVRHRVKPVTAVHPASAVSGFKNERQRSKGLGPRGRRGEAPPLQKSLPDAVDVLTAVEISRLLSTRATVATPGALSVETMRYAESGNLNSVSSIPSAATTRNRPKSGKERKTKKPLPNALSDAVAPPRSSPAAREPMTFPRPGASTAPPRTQQATERVRGARARVFYMTTAATPFISPMQLSIQRAKEQFVRKKRRKAALFSGQQ